MSDIDDFADGPSMAAEPPQRRSNKPKRDRRQDPNVPDDHETRFNSAMMALGVNQPSARVTITRLRPSEDKLPSVRGAQVPTFDDFVRYMRDTHWSGDNEEYEWVVYNGRSQYQKRGRLTIAEDPVKQAQFRADRKRRIDEIRSMSDPTAAQPAPMQPPPPMGFQQQPPQYGQPPMAPIPPHAYQQPAPPYYQPQYAPPQPPPPVAPPQPPPMATQQSARRREEEEDEEYDDRDYRQRRDYRERDAYRPRQEYEEPQQRYYQPAPVPVSVPVPVTASDPRMDAMSAELRQVMEVVRSLSAELGGAKAVSREINPQIAEIHRVAADLQRQMEQYQQQRQMEAAQPPPQQQVYQPPQPSPQQHAQEQEQQARRNRPRRVPDGYMLAHLSGDPEDPPVLVPIPPGMPGHRPDMVPGYQAPPMGALGGPHGAYQPSPYGQQQVPPPPPPAPPPREEGGDLEKGITGILGMIERTEHAKQTLSRSLGLVEKSAIEKEDATPAQAPSNIPQYEDLGFWKFNKREDGKLDMNPLNSFMLNLDKVKDIVGSITEGAAKLQREQAKAENDELERRVALEERLARVRQGSASASPVQNTAQQQNQSRHTPVHSGLPSAHGVNEFRQNPVTSVPSGGDDDSDDDEPSPFGL